MAESKSNHRDMPVSLQCRDACDSTNDLNLVRVWRFPVGGVHVKRLVFLVIEETGRILSDDFRSRHFVDQEIFCLSDAVVSKLWSIHLGQTNHRWRQLSFVNAFRVSGEDVFIDRLSACDHYHTRRITRVLSGGIGDESNAGIGTSFIEHHDLVAIKTWTNVSGIARVHGV